MRPRAILLAACPWLTREEASDALRNAGGDVEQAKRAVSASRRKSSTKTSSTSDEQKKNGEPSMAAAKQPQQKNDGALPARAPPRHSVSINNLSDRQYCCVWSVEVYEDGYRPDVARTLLATVARHVNPILRDRGWRVKRLIESASTQWIGLCTANGRNDADAASTNIQLNLRVRPDKHCKQFRSFQQILAVMLHEITHTSIGLEDIHPPAFWELLDQIKLEYKQKLANGEVDLETDDYGCKGKVISKSGEVASVSESASDVLGRNDFNNLGLLGAAGSEGDCGAKKGRRRGGGWKKRYNKGSSKGFTSNVPKKRPLLKGAKMVDKRTRVGKAAMKDRENLSARELAARAAMARFGGPGTTAAAAASTSSSIAKGSMYSDDESESEDEVKPYKKGEIEILSSDEEEDEDNDEPIKNHGSGCGCRCCDWEKLFNLD